MRFEAIYLDQYSQGPIIFTQTLQLDITFFLSGLQYMQLNKCVQKLHKEWASLQINKFQNNIVSALSFQSVQ